MHRVWDVLFMGGSPVCTCVSLAPLHTCLVCTPRAFRTPKIGRIRQGILKGSSTCGSTYLHHTTWRLLPFKRGCTRGLCAICNPSCWIISLGYVYVCVCVCVPIAGYPTVGVVKTCSVWGGGGHITEEGLHESAPQLDGRGVSASLLSLKVTGSRRRPPCTSPKPEPQGGMVL